MNNEKLSIERPDETLQESFERILAEYPRLKEIENGNGEDDFATKEQIDKLKDIIDSLEKLKNMEFSIMDRNNIMRKRVRVISYRRLPGQRDWELKLIDLDDQDWDDEFWNMSLFINSTIEAMDLAESAREGLGDTDLNPEKLDAAMKIKMKSEEKE